MIVEGILYACLKDETIARTGTTEEQRRGKCPTERQMAPKKNGSREFVPKAKNASVPLQKKCKIHRKYLNSIFFVQPFL